MTDPVFTIPLPVATSAQWASADKNTIVAVIGGVTLNVPDDPRNSDRQAIQRWQDAGNTIADPPGPTKRELGAYLESTFNKVLAAGIVVTIGKNAIHCDGAPQTRGDLAGFYAWGQANPTEVRGWVDETGRPFMLTGAQFVTLALAVGNWVDNCYLAGAAAGGEIVSGKITTKAQIDALTWPTA